MITIVPRKKIVEYAALIRDRSCRFEICVIIQPSRKASKSNGLE